MLFYIFKSSKKFDISRVPLPVTKATFLLRKRGFLLYAKIQYCIYIQFTTF